MAKTNSTVEGAELPAVAVRELQPDEWRAAFPVIAALRTHLTIDEFLDRVGQQSRSGYQLIGAFAGGHLVGVVGVRPVQTLARGPHLHVDDLVVADEEHRAEVGRLLMEQVEREAEARGMGAVFVDARPEAVTFYKSLGFGLHPAPSMRKLL